MVIPTLRVLAAIQLDNQHSLKADEIHDEPPELLLPAKFESTKLPMAEKPPHLALGISRLVAHAPSATQKKVFGHRFLPAPPPSPDP